MDNIRRLREEHESLVNRRPSGPDDRVRRLVESNQGIVQTEPMGTETSNAVKEDPASQLHKTFSVRVPSRIQDSLKRELWNKLRVRKESLEREESQRARQHSNPEISPEHNPVLSVRPHSFDGRTPSIASTDKKLMEELKQRLSKTSVTSAFDIDRIVKESKTTTITESRETVHFRPNETPKPARRTLVLPPQVTSKRLSITSSSPGKVETASLNDTHPIYENINEGGRTVKNGTKFGGSVNDKEKEQVDKLMGEYAKLDADISDINRKNRQLKQDFLTDSKKETPILKNTTFEKSTIDNWETSSSSSRTMKPRPTGAVQNTSQKPLDVKTVSVPLQKKTEGCRKETFDYRYFKITKKN